MLKTLLQANPIKSKLLLIVMFLVLVMVLCVFMQSLEAGSQERTRDLRQAADRRSMDYETDSPICGQTRNRVPNPGFEQGIGVENGWMQTGPCTFDIGPGHDSANSAKILAESALHNRSCKLLSVIDQIRVEPEKVYDYSVWMNTTLGQGSAHLAITFWRKNKKTWKQVGEAFQTDPVTDTLGEWVPVVGWVQAPAKAEYARVEVTLDRTAQESYALYDDINFSLSTCLGISKSDDPHSVLPGEILTYTIIYSNTGSGTAADVWIYEDYDEYVTLIPERTEPVPDIGDYGWSVGNLDAHTSGVITAVVRVEHGAEVRRWLLNTVEIRNDEILEPFPSALISTYVHIPTLTCALDLRIDEREKLGRPGEAVEYELELANIGDYNGRCCLAADSSLGWRPEFVPWTCEDLPIDSAEPVTLRLEVPGSVAFPDRDTTQVVAILDCEAGGSIIDQRIDRVRTSVASSVFLPSMARDFSNCSWESEPNNTCCDQDADGPLRNNSCYHGYTDDQYDLFKIEFPGGRLVLHLAVETGEGIQMGLTRDCYNWMDECFDGDPADGYHLDCDDLAPGLYYFEIYTETPFYSDDKPYTLEVAFFE